MEPKVNYTVVGTFVITLTTALILGILWFGSNQKKETITYVAYMNEAVSGLSVQAPVKFNGVDVGTVDSIQLNPNNPQQVELILSINEGTPVNQSTTATLLMQGITGVTYVGLKATKPHAPPIKVFPGNKYPIIPTTPSLIYELTTVLHGVSDSIEKLTKGFGTLLNPANQAHINEILANTAQLSKTLAGSSNDIRTGLSNASQTFAKAKITTQTINQQALPGTVDSLQRLGQVLNNLEQITNSLKTNPSLLIRGKAPPPLGPGE